MTSQYKLTLCAIPVMTNYRVPTLLANFQKKYPFVSINIQEIETIHILNQLEKHLCEIAYHRIFHLSMNSYEKITLDDDHFVAVLFKDHPLAHSKKLCLSDLKDEHFYQLGQSTQLMESFELLCKEAGFVPNVAYMGTRIDNILDFVSNHFGIAILMKKSIPIHNYKNIVLCELEHTIVSELAFIRKKESSHSHACNLFWNFMKTYKKPNIS